MKKILFILALLTCLIQTGSGQTWEKLFSALSHDVFRSVVEVPSGGFVAAGYTSNFSPNDTDGYVVKVNTVGDTVWTYTYNGTLSKSDLFYKVINTSDGGFIMCGYTTSVTGLSDDMLIVKLNSSGQKQWAKTFGGSGKERVQDIIQSADGKYSICGYTTSSPAQYYDAFLLRLKSDGSDSLWMKRYGASNYDDANSLRELADGGFILGGQSSNGQYGFDQYLVRTNSAGDTLWTKRFGFPSNSTENIDCVRLLPDGYILAGGSDDTTIYKGNNGYLVKTDTSGNVIWSKVYGNNQQNDFHSVELLSGGGFVLCGTTTEFTPNDSLPSIWLVKTNDIGDTLWTRIFGGSRHDHGYSAIPASDGGYVAAGFSSSFGYDLWDEAYLIKTNGTGNVTNRLVYTFVRDILTPNASTCGSGTTQVKIVINNFSLKPVTNIPCTLEVSGAITQTISQTFSASADTVVFTTTLNTSAGGTFTLYCYTANDNDVIPARNGMTKTFTINLTPSIPNVTGNSRCGTGTVALSASGPGTLYWYTVPAGGVSVFTGTNYTTPSLSTTTNYYVQANQVCPSARAQVTASVHPVSGNPIITNDSRCGPGTLTLQATSPDTVKWYDAPTAGNLVATGPIFNTTSLSTTTNYYALATNGFCPSSRMIATATVSSVAADPTTASSQRCGPGPDTLVATSPDNINWYDAPTNGTLVSTNHVFITSSLASTTTFYAEADNGCVSNRVPATVTINPLAPSPVPTSDQNCGPGILTLSATAANPISWFAGPSGGTALATGPSFTTPFISTTTFYYVEAYNGTCPSNRIVASAFITPLPAVNLGNDTTVFGNSYPLDAGAGYPTYVWSTGATTQTISVLASDTFCVTVTDATGCSNSDCVFVDLITGTTEISRTKFFSVYPNPASNRIVVELSSSLSNTELDVLDIAGEVVQSTESDNSGSVNIELSSLARGIYFVRLRSEGLVEMQKIILQ